MHESLNRDSSMIEGGREVGGGDTRTGPGKKKEEGVKESES